MSSPKEVQDLQKLADAINFTKCDEVAELREKCNRFTIFGTCDLDHFHQMQDKAEKVQGKYTQKNVLVDGEMKRRFVRDDDEEPQYMSASTSAAVREQELKAEIRQLQGQLETQQQCNSALRRIHENYKGVMESKLKKMKHTNDKLTSTLDNIRAAEAETEAESEAESEPLSEASSSESESGPEMAMARVKIEPTDSDQEMPEAKKLREQIADDTLIIDEIQRKELEALRAKGKSADDSIVIE
jgi:hypothetical protein